jgi:hypothetical protein
MRRRDMPNAREELQIPAQQEESVDEENGIGLTLLNSIDNTAQALQFYEEMLDDVKHIEFINLRHIKPALTTEKLKEMTGRKDRDGKFY